MSIRWRPEATQTIGSPSATNTIDLAISASWQPTATAASSTVRVDASSRWTCICEPELAGALREPGLSCLTDAAAGRCA